MPAQAALFVLGMHRSGTSALARTLALLGAALPRNLVGPAPGNELGHWEPEPAVRLHDRILATAGTSVNDVRGPAEGWFETAAANAYVDEMAALVRAEFGDAPLFVFKDPRSALVFPLWRRTLARLSIRCLPIIVTRNPLEVARSLAKRQVAAEPDQSWPLDRGGLLWLRYVLAAERHTRAIPRVFCGYAELLADWRALAGRLARELGLAWPRPPSEAAPDIDAFLSGARRHHHEPDAVGAGNGIWSSWVAPVYDALREARAGRELDVAVLDNVAHEFEKACADVAPEMRRTASHRHATQPAPMSGKSNARTATRRRIAIVVTPAMLAGERAHALRARVASIAGTPAAVTLVTLDASVDRELDALAATHGVDVQRCSAIDLSIEPAFMRPTITLYRHLCDEAFDTILFPDRDGLGHASIVAKRAGLAFAGTTLGVLASESSRWLRETEGRFPASPVTLAIEHIEQRAIEDADVVEPGSDAIKRWMEDAGWVVAWAPSVSLAATGAKSAPADARQRVATIARSTAEGAPSHAKRSDARDVTVLVTHFEQPALLEQNLAALARQSDRGFSVIVVDDGSRGEGAVRYLADVERRYAALGLRLIRQDNRYVGAARNAGIRAADSAFVVVLDDDNVAFPDMVRTLRRAIDCADADIVTCGLRLFDDAVGPPPTGVPGDATERYFSGGPLLLGAIHNCFGDATGIYRRTVFERVGGFHEHHGVPFEDWHLHFRAVASGLRLVSLPEPLAWYRVRADGMLRTTRRYDGARLIASAVDALPCAALTPLSDYLMGSEEELVRLNAALARSAAVVRGGDAGLAAVTAARNAALADASTAATRHARNLESMLEARDRSARDAEAYARSLERALAELRASHATATEYAAALERARADAETYAKSLEAEVRALKDHRG